ncbi:hypothetical protein [Klebsiella sp. PL-2018]|uniref:hypothetical protein n=1 Tax=Klebsiella sp. PL-2018 TaxID=2851540 RepID=UPI001C777E47|nr:hypothetical protein [Klebsiella sp. PL-2018]QXC99334.1 hypothetical protein MKleb_3834 [Klebsiella sp. PL-2018]
MRKIQVTITNLAERVDGAVCGAQLAFKVRQNGSVLISDFLTGKISGPYTRTYEVDASDSVLTVEHNRHDLPGLTITASLN